MLVRDERRHLRRFVRIVFLLLGIEKVLLLEDRMQLPERLEDPRLVREIEVALLGEQAFEDELVRRRSAEADVGVAVPDDLVVGPVMTSRRC